jgi:hypothetical protein
LRGPPERLEEIVRNDVASYGALIRSGRISLS